MFTLKVLELALMRLEVRDHDADSMDEFEGQACLPIHEIKDSYPCVQLYNKKGMVLPPFPEGTYPRYCSTFSNP